MIGSVDGVHREALAFYFRAMYCLAKSGDDTSSGVSVAMIAAATSENPSPSSHDILALSGLARTQIMARSKGLIELAVSKLYSYDGDAYALSSYEKQHLVWLHRSAYDYIFNHPKSTLIAWVEACDESKTTEQLLKAQVILVRLTSIKSSDYSSMLCDYIDRSFKLAGKIRERVPEIADNALDELRDILEQQHDGRLVLEDSAVPVYPGAKWLSLQRIYSGNMFFWKRCLMLRLEAYISSRTHALTKYCHSNLLCAWLIYSTADTLPYRGGHWCSLWLKIFAETVHRLKVESELLFCNNATESVRKRAGIGFGTAGRPRQVVKSLRYSYTSTYIRNEAQIIYYLCRALTMMYELVDSMPLAERLDFESIVLGLDVWEPFT
ncbi:hypothetical protein LTR95_004805 [Oleoguttula sp. CCFEE 5521]